MKVSEYLNIVAVVHQTDYDIPIYVSKHDSSFITHVGMEDQVNHLANREITQELTSGVGYSPKEGKWYGWSHRAIFGFKIGSTCKKGDCHYVAPTPEELIDDYANFFADISKECADEHRAECQILPDRSGIRILHTPISIPMAHNMCELEEEMENPGTLKEQIIFGTDYSIKKCGKGEWIAESMEDAKQMAKDFNEGVS